jgi:prepilin-type N-terminal cleavage/methylation domain-containing protein
LLRQFLKTRRGFSFIEFCAVATILSIIAAIVVPRVHVSPEVARQKIRDHHVAAINAAVEHYHGEHQVWPADDLHDIGSDPAYFPDGLPVDPLNGSPFRLDSQTHQVR